MNQVFTGGPYESNTKYLAVDLNYGTPIAQVSPQRYRLTTLDIPFFGVSF